VPSEKISVIGTNLWHLCGTGTAQRSCY